MGSEWMTNNELSSQLNEAISLVKTGYRREAHQRFQALAAQYPHVAQIWLWIATTSEDANERIDALRQVLRLDPTNEKARFALFQATGETSEGSAVDLPANAEAIPPPPPATQSMSTGAMVEMTIIAVLVIAALVMAMVVYSSVVSPRLFPTPTWTPTRTPIPPTPTVPTRTPTPTYTPGGPTITPLGYITLPPSWTPRALNVVPPTRTPVDTLVPPATATERPTRQPSATFTAFPTKTVFPTDTPVSQP